MELIEGADLDTVCEQLAGSDAAQLDEAAWQRAISTACDKARNAEETLSGESEASTSEDNKTMKNRKSAFQLRRSVLPTSATPWKSSAKRPRRPTPCTKPA